MQTHTAAAFVLLLISGAAFAHSGVKNAAVMARMHNMSETAAALKTIGEMAKGAAVFDLETARASAAAIADHAAEIVPLFQENAQDPKSEAKPEIWENFADFSAKAKNLETIARQHTQGLRSPDDLGKALREIGGACKACHADYRL